VVHVQQPVKALGINRTAAMLGIFVVSAALHEVVLSVPFKAFKLWAFWGMMGQVPIIIGSRAFRHHKVLGNIIFWSCFAIGQSVIVLMYFNPVHSVTFLQPMRVCCRYYVAYKERLVAGSHNKTPNMHTEL
jgi:diacylglycerol O-acyltransferase-1